MPRDANSVLTMIEAARRANLQVLYDQRGEVIPPWDYWFAVLEQQHGDRANEVFASMQKETSNANLYGFIVARWCREGELPDEYWSGLIFKALDDSAETPYPYIFRTLAGAKRAIERLRRRGGSNIGLFLWISPEANEVSKTQWDDLRLIAGGPKVVGHRFPGCPRR